MSRVHPTAIVDPRAEIDDDVQIGPYCVIGASVRIGKGVKFILTRSLPGAPRWAKATWYFLSQLSVTRRRISNIKANPASF